MFINSKFCMVPPFIPNDKMMYPLIPQIDPLALIRLYQLLCSESKKIEY